MADHIEKWGGAWSMCQSTVLEIPLNTTALTFVGAVFFNVDKQYIIVYYK